VSCSAESLPGASESRLSRPPRCRLCLPKAPRRCDSRGARGHVKPIRIGSDPTCDLATLTGRPQTSPLIAVRCHQGAVLEFAHFQPASSAPWDLYRRREHAFKQRKAFSGERERPEAVCVTLKAGTQLVVFRVHRVDSVLLRPSSGLSRESPLLTSLSGSLVYCSVFLDWGKLAALPLCGVRFQDENLGELEWREVAHVDRSSQLRRPSLSEVRILRSAVARRHQHAGPGFLKAETGSQAVDISEVPGNQLTLKR